MKVFILDGLENGDASTRKITPTLVKVIERFDSSITNVRLREHDMQSCIGDFGCLVKTPGKCIFNDFGRMLPKYFVESDIAVFITRLTFGGYSSLFTKAYNRMSIQVESRNFCYYKGENIRKKLYNKDYPALFAIGITEKENQKENNVFESLVGRNAFKLFINKYKSLVVTENEIEEENFEMKINNCIESLKNE